MHGAHGRMDRCAARSGAHHVAELLDGAQRVERVALAGLHQQLQQRVAPQAVRAHLRSDAVTLGFMMQDFQGVRDS